MLYNVCSVCTWNVVNKLRLSDTSENISRHTAPKVLKNENLWDGVLIGNTKMQFIWLHFCTAITSCLLERICRRIKPHKLRLLYDCERNSENLKVYYIGSVSHSSKNDMFRSEIHTNYKQTQVRVCIVPRSLPPTPRANTKRLITLATLTSQVLRLDSTKVRSSQWQVARSKAWTVFARSNTGIVGSNPTAGMDVCVLLLCVRVVLCVAGETEKKKADKLHKGCRAIDR
jgi:hypothetical protein